MEQQGSRRRSGELYPREFPSFGVDLRKAIYHAEAELYTSLPSIFARRAVLNPLSLVIW